MKTAFHISFSIIKPLLLLLTLSNIAFTKGCLERERLALLDFKKSFASFPNNYGKLSSWSSSDDAKDCCSWEGITCDDPRRHVVDLDLSYQGLESHGLRSSLLELQHLTSLDLGGNNFAMRIPEFVGSFSKLTYLGISEAGFFGMVPPQLGNLSKIQYLDMGFNNLSTGNLEWLSHLSYLEKLFMSYVNFSEAGNSFPVIRELPNLFYFECVHCHFPSTAINSHYVNISSSLETLYLDSSHMSSSILLLLTNASANNLKEVNLAGLELDVPFPNIFHGLISLEMLDLSSNELEDGIFNSIGNLCKLNKLHASWCIINHSLSDILQALSSGCARSSLEEILLDSMNLAGVIPPMLKFHSLTTLNLGDNNLDNFPNTTLPIFPRSLTNFYAENNNLNGVLTDLHFANFSRLQNLNLANNPKLRLSFNKPLAKDSSVRLSSCNLGPSFPPWLFAENNIMELDISNSMISSTVPIMFWENISPFLHYLNLSANSLQGVVPNLPFRFSDPELIIDLTSNSFSGLIPSSFFKANELHLSNNNFSGFAPIPHPYNLSTFFPKDFFSNDPGAPNILDLSNNILSGVLPHWLSFLMPKLGALILSNNHLSGPLPSSIAHSVPIYVLSLSNNKFSGPLPSMLRNCSQLRILDLGGNNFSSFIPSWIGEALKNLTVFSLRSNSLSGSLPTNLCHLISLQILDVSHNLLSGNIPSCINEFTAMAHDVNPSEEVSYREGETIMINPLELASYYNAYIKWKSKVWKFQSTLHLVKLIDLSSNNLSGEIPMGLASLVKLDSIDLSCNGLQGSVPEQIGKLKSLQFLNLSSNRLCGEIPQSFSEISALEMLDLSHNNLSGRIPKSTQLQSFDPSAFAGNPLLCGLPLRKCPNDNDDAVQPPQPSPTSDSEMQDNWANKQCFYAGMGVGFACGLLGILGTLHWIRKWRIAFFQFSTDVGEWMLLVVALNLSKISRKLQSK